MARKSFLDCPHKNVQQFTECCNDCGYNIHTTKEKYLEQLRQEAKQTEVRKLERRLGIGKNQRKKKKK